ncbi:MAG TPA: hypothetical protein VF506_13550 [Streptosporangiaceae bacterium]
METQTTSVSSRPHPISNTFHLIMTICTGGLWIPVWIFMARGHKTTTRTTTVTTSPALDPDAQWRAQHVPASPEYKAAHPAPAPEDGWGTRMMNDMVAAGATRAEARSAFLAELKKRNGR